MDIKRKWEKELMRMRKERKKRKQMITLRRYDYEINGDGLEVVYHALNPSLVYIYCRHCNHNINNRQYIDFGIVKQQRLLIYNVNHHKNGNDHFFRQHGPTKFQQTMKTWHALSGKFMNLTVDNKGLINWTRECAQLKRDGHDVGNK